MFSGSTRGSWDPQKDPGIHKRFLRSPLEEGGEGGGRETEAMKHPRQQRRGDAEGSRKHRRRSEAKSFDLGLLEPLGLGPPVLEPDLDLGLGELELGGELGPLGDRQVLLLPELLLQAVQLLGREGRPRLPVRLVLPQRAAQGTHGGPGV